MTHLISFKFKFPGSPTGFCVAQSLIFCVVFYRPLFICCSLACHCIVTLRAIVVVIVW